MCNDLIFRGGGQHTVPQDVAIIRTRQYCASKWDENIANLSTDHRTIVTYVLHDFHGCTYTQIALLCNVHRLSTGNDIKRAWLYVKKMRKFRAEAQALEDYIIYNAKWLP